MPNFSLQLYKHKFCKSLKSCRGVINNLNCNLFFNFVVTTHDETYRSNEKQIDWKSWTSAKYWWVCAFITCKNSGSQKLIIIFFQKLVDARVSRQLVVAPQPCVIRPTGRQWVAKPNSFWTKIDWKKWSWMRFCHLCYEFSILSSTSDLLFLVSSSTLSNSASPGKSSNLRLFENLSPFVENVELKNDSKTN